MATVARRSDYSLETQLYSQTFEFEFTQAIRILESLKQDAISFGLGDDPSKEALQIQSRITFSVSSSDLFSLKHQRNPAKPPILTVNFLGIAGIQGPLPTAYTEILIERLRKKDTAFRDFLDIFNHRLVSVWHRLNQKTILGVEQTSPDNTSVGRCFFDLIGLSNSALRNKLSVADRSLLLYTPLFWQSVRSSAGLKTLLQGYFKIPVEIKELQGTWRSPPPEDWSRIGLKGQHNHLGKSTILGKRSWDQAGGIKITIPKLSWATYLTHLPGGKGHDKILSLTRFYCGINTGIYLSASLIAKEIPPTKLNQGLLGQTTWLTRGQGLGFKNNPERQLIHVKA